ncbi:MAG TPA: amino acid adenylation domain-containing protein, partial [Candidatus Deferrimicrobium sp.]|nr:amino acid adenylation domain-containing protein [Candidatus Deferrimicrobium sp.]
MNKQTLPGQEAIVAATHYTRERDYWAEKLSGDIVKSIFPYDHDGQGAGENKKTEVFAPQDEAVAALLRIANHSHPRMHMILTAVLAILLEKYSGHNDIIIGTPIYEQGIAAEFVNTVLNLRIRVEPGQTFKEFLLSVRQTIIEAVENQNYPIGVLPLQAEVSFSAGDLPLFDTVILLENIHNKKYLGDITPNIGFIFQRVENENRLQMAIDYNPELYRRETILRIGKNYLVTLNAVLAGLDIKIGAIDVISAEEKTQLLFEFNNTAVEYPRELTINRLFEKQVEETPDRVALVGEGPQTCPITMSYNELNEQSQRLAGLLIKKGVRGDDIIGIMMERSIEMIIGIFGILKSGGAYMPIDPEYPQERIDYMLKDSGAKWLVTANDRESEKVRMPEDEKSNRSNHLAYVIYTSGSTGKPKGVLTMHANVVRVVKNTNYIDITPADRLLQLSNYAFDGSVFDIYGALLNGAALILIKKETAPAVDRLAKIIKHHQITVFFVTTALFNVFVDFEIECLKNVRKVLFGGERVSVGHISSALESLGKGKIIHVYGPTETTVYATYYFVDEIAPTASTIPIGKPLANTTIYIMDKNMKLVPIGACGEIYIGGEGNARGYLNNPELTAERFVNFHHLTFYKTGDKYLCAYIVPDSGLLPGSPKFFSTSQ